MLEELDHVNQSIAEGVKGQDKAVDYVTSFLYQVRQLCSSETDEKLWIKHVLYYETI